MEQLWLRAEDFHDEVLEIIKGTESYKQDESLLEVFADEYAWLVAINAEKSMKRYIHEDTNICGNMADIRINYENDFPNKCFRDVVKRTDNCELSSDELKSLRDWTKGWLLYAFGTFGITYNFSNLAESFLHDFYECE